MKVVVKKFKRVENLTLNVPAHISGANGSGKSTILEAISFCLTGKSLQGNELKAVYDNREDLHDAIADVSYFDDYNNEFRRVV
jgi:recombinational DNA repair ATPase RecF